MNKDKEVDANLIMEMANLTILYKRKENLYEKGEYKGKIKWKGGNSYQGGYNSYRGRGNSNPRGGFHGKCYRYGGEGHRSFECKSYGEIVGRNVVIQGEFE